MSRYLQPSLAHSRGLDLVPPISHLRTFCSMRNHCSCALGCWLYKHATARSQRTNGAAWMIGLNTWVYAGASEQRSDEMLLSLPGANFKNSPVPRKQNVYAKSVKTLTSEVMTSPTNVSRKVQRPNGATTTCATVTHMPRRRSHGKTARHSMNATSTWSTEAGTVNVAYNARSMLL